MDKKLNILHAGFNFSHHSPSSGYHQLSKYIECDYVNANKFIFGNRSIGNGSKLRLINFMVFELYLINKIRKYDLVHYIYPEQHLILSNILNKRTVSVATIHLDESWLDKKYKSDRLFVETRRNAFNQLDGIITLSSGQAIRLRKILNNKRIIFIPHGVKNLGKYGQVKRDDKFFNIAIIGSNYRDKKTFFEIASYAQINKPNWRFNLIGVSKDWKKKADVFKNIIVHPFLSEEEYFELLQSSHVHLLPIEFATANNALLEAHSLGVPSIISNKSGVKDYSLESTMYFEDISGAINLLTKVENMEFSKYIELRQQTKAESQKYYWESIARKVEDFYKELLIDRKK